MTFAPNAFASWIAAVPMPEEPPWMSSVSPRLSAPRSKTLCHTVKNVYGIAAASIGVSGLISGSALVSCTGEFCA
jgi:hypothetical protein